MKKGLKIFGYVFLSILVILYMVFLFVLPNTINLNPYKAQIQKLVKDNTDLTIDFDDVKVITTPLLEVGLKTQNIKVKLPDDSDVITIDKFKGKVFLPSLLWLTVRVSGAEIVNPNVDIEILNGEQYKVAKVYEDFVNRKRQEYLLNPPVKNDSNAELPIDISKIKLIISNVKLTNYKALVNDDKANHRLLLKGDELRLGYYNGEYGKIKTNAEFYSDNDKNITADLDITSFLPKFTYEKEEEDYEEVYKIPFVNPVKMYRDYDLKSTVNSKINIKKNKKTGKLWAKGYLNVDDTTLKLANLQLPMSYFNLTAKGDKASIDSNLYVTQDENMKISADVNYGQKPALDLSFDSTPVHFSNLLNIIKAYLDSIHLQNDVGNMAAEGYFQGDFNLKTDYKDIISSGDVVVRGGDIHDKTIGLLVDDLYSNILLNDNKVVIKNTHMLINRKPLSISGTIESDSKTNMSILADRIPIPGLYKAFAPKNIRGAYNLSSGYLSLNTKISGTIKSLVALCRVKLENLVLSDYSKNFVIKNKFAHFGLLSYNGEINGRLDDQGLNILLPKTMSTIRDDSIVLNLDNNQIIINDSDLRINKKSNIKFNGGITDYLTGNITSKFEANGILSSSDMVMFLGKDISPYFDAKGVIPMLAMYTSHKDKWSGTVQLKADDSNYITPIKLDELLHKQTIIQASASGNKNVIRIDKTGIFAKTGNSSLDSDLYKNMVGTQKILNLKTTISTQGDKPYINLFKLEMPNELNGSIAFLPKSKFNLSGDLHLYGNIDNPTLSGNYRIKNILIPEILTTINEIALELRNKNIKVTIMNVLANKNHFNIKLQATWESLAKLEILKCKLFSKFVDVNNLLQVSDALVKALPSSSNTAISSSKQSTSTDIPVDILSGFINFRKIKMNNIELDNTIGKISLIDSVLNIKDLRSSLMDGTVGGNVSVDLSKMLIKAKLVGKDFNVDKMMIDVMNMKDTLSGNMDFITDITLKGVNLDDQMKSLKGYIDFNIKHGILGPFGKFENFLLAENLRENAFFSSTIGSVITNIVTFDTSHFNSLFGHLTFADGYANISPIKSQGNVMSMYIAGKVGLIDNSADLKLRGKLASTFSDSLGPLANINPVNLVKNTPGLNIVAAKTFAIFCETVSEEEMKALPELGGGKSDKYATKFQIVLRGDTRKPLKLIKSFKWLALNSEIESAQNFVDTMPIPQPGEENLSVDEIVKLREQQAQEQAIKAEKNKSIFQKLKDKFKSLKSKGN